MLIVLLIGAALIGSVLWARWEIRHSMDGTTFDEVRTDKTEDTNIFKSR